MGPTPRRGRRTGAHASLEGDTIVVVPVGSWEQHGPHLPHDTDSVIAESLADAAVEQTALGRFLVAPTVAFSASDEHAGFPGLLSAGTAATTELLVALARSAGTWSRGVVFVNGHGGNADALVEVRRRLAAESVTHEIWWPRAVPGRDGDLHAGRTETAVMMHLAPDLVVASAAAPGATGSTTDLMERMRDGGVAAVSANGVVGDPTGATATEGAEIFATWVESLSDLLVEVDRRWQRR